MMNQGDEFQSQEAASYYSGGTVPVAPTSQMSPGQIGASEATEVIHHSPEVTSLPVWNLSGDESSPLFNNKAYVCDLDLALNRLEHLITSALDFARNTNIHRRTE